MRGSAIVLVLSLAWVGNVGGQSVGVLMPGGNAYKATRKYKDAYQKGRDEADQQLKDQCATIYTIGSGMWPAERLDRGTGLRHRWLGCGICDEIVGRIDGHNDRIREFIKENGYPKYSYKPWEKVLFGLKAYTESRRKAVTPATLTVNGPAWKSTDGSCTVRVVKKSGDGPNLAWVQILAEGRPPEESYVLAEGTDTFELFPGPEGSGLAVLAWKTSQCGCFQALDLKKGTSLRAEQDVPRAMHPDDKLGDRPGAR